MFNDSNLPSSEPENQDNPPGLDIIVPTDRNLEAAGRTHVYLAGSEINLNRVSAEMRQFIDPILLIVNKSFQSGVFVRYINIVPGVEVYEPDEFEVEDVEGQQEASEAGFIEAFRQGKVQVMLEVQVRQHSLDEILDGADQTLGSDAIHDAIRQQLFLTKPLGLLLEAGFNQKISSLQRMLRKSEEAGQPANQVEIKRNLEAIEFAITTLEEAEEEALSPEDKLVLQVLRSIAQANGGVLLRDHLILAKGGITQELTAEDLTRLRNGIVRIALNFEYLTYNESVLSHFVESAVKLWEHGFPTFKILPIAAATGDHDITILSVENPNLEKRKDFLEIGMDIDYLRLLIGTIEEMDRTGLTLTDFTPDLFRQEVLDTGEVVPFISITPQEDPFLSKTEIQDIRATINRRSPDLYEWVREVEKVAAEQTDRSLVYLKMINHIFESIFAWHRELLESYLVNFEDKVMHTQSSKTRREGIARLTRRVERILLTLGAITRKGEINPKWVENFDSHFGQVAQIFENALNRGDKQEISVLPNFISPATEDEMSWEITDGTIEDEDVETVSDIEDVAIKVKRTRVTVEEVDLEVTSMQSKYARERIASIKPELDKLRLVVQRAAMKYRDNTQES